MRAIPVICLISLFSTACAAQHKSSPAPDMYYDDAGAAAIEAAPMVADAEAVAAPAAGGGFAQSVSAPAGVVAAVPAGKASAGDGKGDTAEADLDDLRTLGADSIEQMIIFTGQLSLEVEFSAAHDAIDDAVSMAVAAGGYVATMTDTSATLRVPSKSFRKVMRGLESVGDVLSRGVQAVDVSEEFNDLEVRLENLQATRKRIEKLLAQTKDLSQILVVEKELQRVTVEIDRLEGRMRMLSSQAAFSTIALAVSERPEQQEVKVIARDDDAPPPPPPPPKTLASSAAWVGGVGVHKLMHLE